MIYPTSPEQIATRLTDRQREADDRQALIDEYIDACKQCGSWEFPKRSDCDGCTAAADEEIGRRVREEVARG